MVKRLLNRHFTGALLYCSHGRPFPPPAQLSIGYVLVRQGKGGHLVVDGSITSDQCCFATSQPSSVQWIGLTSSVPFFRPSLGAIELVLRVEISFRAADTDDDDDDGNIFLFIWSRLVRTGRFRFAVSYHLMSKTIAKSLVISCQVCQSHTASMVGHPFLLSAFGTFLLAWLHTFAFAFGSNKWTLETRFIWPLAGWHVLSIEQSVEEHGVEIKVDVGLLFLMIESSWEVLWC